MKGSEHSDVNTFISILEVNIFIFYTKQAIHTCRDRATKILKSFFDQRPQRPISSSCIQNDALKIYLFDITLCTPSSAILQAVKRVFSVGKT